ncbi:MAG: hypothetical protein QXH37_04675 [Candidatus Bathyarchaeia archaeon]
MTELSLIDEVVVNLPLYEIGKGLQEILKKLKSDFAITRAKRYLDFASGNLDEAIHRKKKTNVIFLEFLRFNFLLTAKDLNSKANTAKGYIYFAEHFLKLKEYEYALHDIDNYLHYFKKNARDHKHL